MDKIIDYIAELMCQYVKPTRDINSVYKGDPIYIPENDFPCIIIQPNTTAIESQDSAEDQAVWNISISIVSDGRKYFNSEQNETSQFVLTKIMEEKESDSNKLKSDTIVDTIRNVLDSNSNYVLRTQNYNLDYGFKIRAARYSATPEEYYPTVEATLTFEAVSIGYLRD